MGERGCQPSRGGVVAEGELVVGVGWVREGGVRGRRTVGGAEGLRPQDEHPFAAPAVGVCKGQKTRPSKKCFIAPVVKIYIPC